MNEQNTSTLDLAESRLYTFLSETREFALYFLEGQKLIHDLALLHNVSGAGFAYFREVLLSVQPLIALLKHGEQLGFYIDSEKPTFRLKIETAHTGQTRSVVWPETFKEFPSEMTGVVRVQKLFPHNRPPYNSILEVNQQPLKAIVNAVLEHSYQVNSSIHVSGQADQSIMLHQLPPVSSVEDYEISEAALSKRAAELKIKLSDIFQQGLQNSVAIEASFKALGFNLLSSREVKFYCQCSKERMVQTMIPIFQEDPNNIFDPDQDQIEIKCEYCKSLYQVYRKELSNQTDSVN